jgi:hypothetical protein
MLLKVILPFFIAFLVGRVFYGWIDKTSLQSSDFSPTVAAILTTPLLTFSYFLIAARDFVLGNVRSELTRMAIELIWFGPIFLILSPLLVIYLRGRFRGKKLAGIFLSGATFACLVLECVWLYFALGTGS